MWRRKDVPRARRYLVPIVHRRDPLADAPSVRLGLDLRRLHLRKNGRGGGSECPADQHLHAAHSLAQTELKHLQDIRGDADGDPFRGFLDGVVRFFRP